MNSNLALIAALSGAFALAACAPETPAEEAAQAVEDSADAAAEAVDDAMEEPGMMEQSGEAMDDMASDAAAAVEGAADAAADAVTDAVEGDTPPADDTPQ